MTAASLEKLPCRVDFPLTSSIALFSSFFQITLLRLKILRYFRVGRYEFKFKKMIILHFRASMDNHNLVNVDIRQNSIFLKLRFQNIFPLANSFAKWKNVRRWQAPYGTQLLLVSECVIKYTQLEYM